MTRQIFTYLFVILFAVAAASAAAEAEAGGDPIYTSDQVDVKPVRIDGPLPGYPELPKEERIEGRVVARVVIESDGTVGAIEIVESLRDDFDALSLENLRQWTFEPARIDGEPVRLYYHLTVNYQLNGDKKENGDADRR